MTNVFFFFLCMLALHHALLMYTIGKHHSWRFIYQIIEGMQCFYLDLFDLIWAFSEGITNFDSP